MAAHNATQRIRTAATNEAVFFAYRVAIPSPLFQVEKGNFYQMPYLIHFPVVLSLFLTIPLRRDHHLHP